MSVTKTIRDISELAPNAQKACNLFMAECKKQGLNVLITETYRSQARQDYLYAQGRTRKGNIVTWTKSSRHTSRRAWDICKNVKGKEYSDASFFKKCGEVAKKFNITWGGTWTKIEAGRFIEATATAGQVGTNVAAGLPNITGTWGFARGAFGSQYSATGAFRYTPRGSTQPAGESGAGDGELDFNASRSSTIYGNSSTVQPKSIRAFVWRRTA